MSETKAAYDPADASLEGPALDDSATLKAAFSFLPTSTIYNADNQIRSLLDLAQGNEEAGAGALIAGFLLLHKDLDRIATALEMRNRGETTNQPLSRRIHAVDRGAQP